MPWQLLEERYDPRLRSRAAGQLLELLHFDFTGDALAEIEHAGRVLDEEFDRLIQTR